MSFLAWERRVAVNSGIEVSSAHMLDLSGSLDVLRSGVWKLDPVLKEVIIDPVDELVDSLATLFVRPVSTLFFGFFKDTLNDPVVTLDAKHLTPESKSGGATQNCQSLHSLGKFVSLLLTERNSSPFE
jgi:hypothetical protein